MAEVWQTPFYELTDESGKNIIIDVTLSADPRLPCNNVITSLVALLREEGVKRIIDFGAGGLRHALPLLHAGFEVCAVEFEETFIRPICAKYLSAAEVDPRFSLIHPRDFIQDCRKFDAALLCYVVQIMPVEQERKLALKQLYRKLREDGYLLYMSKFVNRFDEMPAKHKVSDGFYTLPDHQHHSFYREFTAEETHKTMNEFGFRLSRSLKEVRTDQIFLYTKEAQDRGRIGSKRHDSLSRINPTPHLGDAREGKRASRHRRVVPPEPQRQTKASARTGDAGIKQKGGNVPKPRVFIGSSSEGLPIAEAVFTHLNRDTIPTLWTHQLFLPGRYPLEVLERELKRNAFAVLVASPDDEVVKRDASSPAMRDNLLLEFGLFSGALGRRRAFFICPSSPRIELPSDLFGILTATYDATRVAGGADERAAAVQTACQQIREVINEEWESIKQSEADHVSQLRASQESQAVQRLYTVATRLRDALIAVQRDAFAALSDRAAFEQVRRRAADEVSNIAKAFTDDARTIGVEPELEQLRVATNDALLDLPFPQELSLGRDAGRRQAADVGMQTLDIILRGGNPLKPVQDVAAEEAGGRLSTLGRRYTEWWEKHSPRIQEATAKMHDALFGVLVRISSVQLKA